MAVENSRWHAIHVRRRWESFVASHLQGLVEECYVPLRRVAQLRDGFINVPLFPGYVFSKCTPAVLPSLSLIPGVLGPGVGESSISEEEIVKIHRIVTAGLPVVAIPSGYLKTEGRIVVVVKSGPLRNLTGILTFNEHTNTARTQEEKPFFIVEVEAIERFIAVEIDCACFRFAYVRKAAEALIS